jgi:16S rRNA (cytosine1402-N4)-methyltransferase
LLQRISIEDLATILEENGDEPQAATLAEVLAGETFPTTAALARVIRGALLRKVMDDEIDNSIRRVFQALRIAVNDELSALDSFLRNLPVCLRPGGRVAILTFHSGEDRRVKKAFEAGLRDGLYADIAREVIRPSPAERRDNPRSGSAKLRWARKAG